MLFGLTRAFQNGMTLPGSTKDHRTAPPQTKGLGDGQVLPGGDWNGVLPTQKILDTNLATPESFTLIGPPIQKLVHIIQSTKTPNHKHTTPFIWQSVAQIKNKSTQGRVCFIQNCKILKKLPPSIPPFNTLNSASGPQIKNPLVAFGLPHQILSKMV